MDSVLAYVLRLELPLARHALRFKAAQRKKGVAAQKKKGVAAHEKEGVAAQATATPAALSATASALSAEPSAPLSKAQPASGTAGGDEDREPEFWNLDNPVVFVLCGVGLFIAAQVALHALPAH